MYVQIIANELQRLFVDSRMNVLIYLKVLHFLYAVAQVF